MLCPVLLDLVATTLVKIYFKDDISKGHKDNLYQLLASYKNKHVLSTMLFTFSQILTCSFVFYLYTSYDLKFAIISVVLVLFLNFIFFLFLSFKLKNNKFYKNYD